MLTEQEWTKAAGVTSDTSNVMCSQYFENKSLKDRRPTSVFFGSVNEIGLVNMAGNVAELVADSDKAFGGSFKDRLKDCTSKSKKDLVDEQHAIGFRVAAVIR